MPTTDRSLIIGLTGGIGSGKSAAMDCFVRLGVPCIDADHVARAVVEPGQPALNAIIERFGKQVLLPSGQLNRAQLRSIVFSNPAGKQWLEHLLHPLIRDHIDHWLSDRSEPYAILCSPLLLETEQHKLVDRILLIDISEEIQVQRTGRRDNNSSEEVKRIISSQMPRPLKQQKADDIILNIRDLDYLEAQVKKYHEQYLMLAQARQHSGKNQSY